MSVQLPNCPSSPICTSFSFSASQLWLGRKRSRFSGGTLKKVSGMSSGSKRRSFKKTSKDWPLMRSTTVPVTSTATL